MLGIFKEKSTSVVALPLFFFFFPKIKHNLEANLSLHLLFLNLSSEGGPEKCHSCPLCSQHPSSPGCLVWISLQSANAVQLQQRNVLAEPLSMHCHFIPGTLQTHSDLIGGIPTMCCAFCIPLPSSSWWWCLIPPFLLMGL